MCSRLVWLWTSLTRLLAPSVATAPSARRFLTLQFSPEVLEKRLAPSSFQTIGSTPSGCTCPGCGNAGAYVLGGNLPGSHPNALKWPQPNGMGSLTTITYSYSNLLDGRLGGGLSGIQIRAAIQEAFSRWAAVAPLRFVEMPDVGPPVSTVDYDARNKPMIRLGHRFVDGSHGILAFGYFPGRTGLAGDIHFDSSEQWSLGPSSGIDLIEVATHEIGHALGLDHSQVPQSIMAPTYVGSFSGLGTSFLYPDDVQGIRALYGAGTGVVIPLTPILPPGQTFALVGSTLYVQGTLGNDRIEIDAGPTRRIAVNGVEYTGSYDEIESVLINGRQGIDVAIYRGSDAAETFILRPGQLSVSGGPWTVNVSNTPIVHVFGGPEDRATMIGSQGNDVLTISPELAHFRGPGFNQVLRGVPTVNVNSLGGFDQAVKYSSQGDDVWIANPRVSTMQGEGFFHRLERFNVVTAHSVGGRDTARFFDSPGNDVFIGRPQSIVMRNAPMTYSLIGWGFSTIQAYSTTGQDVARLFDTPGNDRLLATPTFTSLFNENLRIELSNFQRVFVFSRFGQDEAFVYDSAGDDVVTHSDQTVTIRYPASFVQFSNFSYAAMYGTTGGTNRRPAGPMGLTVDWFGSWL